MRDKTNSETASDNSLTQKPQACPIYQETVFRLGNGNYLYIQTCDTGYDYTLYDRDFSLLDGGQLDDPFASMDAARDEILAIQELSEERIEAIPVAEFEQAQEAAETGRHATPRRRQ